MSAGTKVTVCVRDKDKLDMYLRKFKTQVTRNGNLSKAKERAEGYKKPGVRLKEEKKKNTINSRKNNRKNY
jgi:ribosomal protein S21